MIKLFTSLVVLCFAMIAVAVSSAAISRPTVMPAGTEKWMPVPGMAGVSIAILYGTPDKAGSGVYFERIKMSKDVADPPHYHPTDELATVVRGSVTIGFGNKMDWKNATTLTAGGFVGIPAKVPHYGKFAAGTEIELIGNAPDTTIPIQPSKTSM